VWCIGISKQFAVRGVTQKKPVYLEKGVGHGHGNSGEIRRIDSA
jgi:hypothetical protein